MAAVPVKARVYWRDELGRFARAIDEGSELAIQEAAKEGKILSQFIAPKKTGRLAAAIHTFGGGLQGGWESGHETYMLAQEDGAVPHLIGAGFDVVLFNPGEGFGPVLGPVLHPGNPATHYIKRAFDVISSGLAARVQRHLP